MLGNWQSHAEYQRFMIDEVNRQFKRNPKRVEYYESAILKMYHLNLDIVREDFLPLFSSEGRPSHFQPQLFRSFLLMSHCKHSSIDDWVPYASANPVLCALVGVVPEEFPGASTHRDFYNRLWTGGKPDRLRSIAKKPRGKHGAAKLPPKHPGIVKCLVDKALSGQVFKQIPERLYQTLFMKTAVLPSAAMGLLGDTGNLTISGDGTCVLSNASSWGKKICQCKEACSCQRSFADPQAKWGWDSYHERWFYGYTAYLLSVHNNILKLDLPIYLKFVEASRHDSVSLVTALAHARFLYKDNFTFATLLADSAHDNYPTYDLCRHFAISPVIALNGRSDNRPQVKGLALSGNGIPVCADGHEMLNWGFDKTKYRTKYRCPMVTGKVLHCPFSSNCNKSSYGKTVYLRHASDLRLLTPIPRASPAWRSAYNQRTAAERVNNRILTDYQLEVPKRYGKTKLAFFSFLNAINLHLDAQNKHCACSLSLLIP